MAGRQLAGREQAAGVVGQFQQAHRVGDMRPAFTDDLGEIVLRIAELGSEPLITERLLQCVEVRTLDVLDNGDFERLLVVGFDRDDRHVVQGGTLGRPPAPLASDDLVGIGGARHGAHENGLDDAFLTDRVRQLFEIVFVEDGARVAWIGAQELDRHPLLATGADQRRAFLAGIADEGRKAAAETRTGFLLHSFHHGQSHPKRHEADVRAGSPRKPASDRLGFPHISDRTAKPACRATALRKCAHCGG